MNITLKPGESVAIQFEQTDGEFEIHHSTAQFPNQIVVRESAGIDGNVIGEGLAILYQEQFRYADDSDDSAVEVAVKGIMRPAAVDQPKRVGFFVDANNRVHCTSFVRCNVRDESWLSDAEGPTWVVETLNEENEVIGEYDFYATLEEVETAAGNALVERIIV